MKTFEQVKREMARDGYEMTMTAAEFTAMTERAERDAQAWRAAHRARRAEFRAEVAELRAA